MLRFLMLLVLPAALTVALARPAAAQEIRPELALLSDPPLVAPPAMRPDTARLTELWLLALKRPESELQRQAAEAIARARREGIADLEKMASELVRIVSAEKSHAAARCAAAQALVALDHKQAAGELRAAAAQHGSLIRLVVEPALARWNDKPIRAVWLDRLTNKTVHRRELLLAVDGLGSVRDQQAGKLCLVLAADGHQPADVRLAAARSAGAIADTGWEEQAEKWAGGAVLDRLCAVAVLLRHQSAKAQETLVRLAKDPEPSVMAAALTQLHAIDVELVLPLAEEAIASSDANVRRQGAAAYVLRPMPERVTALARLLDDPHPDLRRQVCGDLFRLAKSAELDASVRGGATAALAGESWRGQEQGALLLASLDHKGAAPRLVELLESTRPEVMVAAAWGLRKLAIPETVPAIFDKARRQTEFRKGGGEPPGLDMQVAHLCEALGLMKHAPAEPMLREYIPKRQDWLLSRMAAMWALGYLHAGKPDEELATQLIARLTDQAPINPEVPTARIGAALALGRMKAASQVDAMRAWMGPVTDPESVDMATRWALIEITGKDLPPTAPPAAQLGTWFLEPLEIPSGR
jgi:hypothetical protein